MLIYQKELYACLLYQKEYIYTSIIQKAYFWYFLYSAKVNDKINHWSKKSFLDPACASIFLSDVTRSPVIDSIWRPECWKWRMMWWLTAKMHLHWSFSVSSMPVQRKKQRQNRKWPVCTKPPNNWQTLKSSRVIWWNTATRNNQFYAMQIEVMTSQASNHQQNIITISIYI